MKNFYRLLVLNVIVLLCLTVGLAAAQEATPEVTPVATPEVPEEAPMSPFPTQPLVACPEEVTETTICDEIVTTPEQMVGVWAVYFNGEPAYIRFNADGSWVTADTMEGTLTGVDPYPAGTSSFDEDGVWESLFTPLPSCQVGRYRVRLIAVGGQPVAINLGRVDDCFAPRWSDYGYTLIWAGEE
jgi:hypothetical protein